MSLRTFTVFQDVPSSDAAKSTTATATAPTTSPVLSSKPIVINHATTPTTAEKENVDPVTGERAGPSNNNSKKRKTSVLVTKVHMPLGMKKQKESEELNPEPKKRKASSTSAAKGKATVKKDGKATGSSRKTTKKPSRRLSPMPKVDEEVEAGRERERLSQAQIDSRCYELTVTPLADVSQAYEECPRIVQTPADDDNVKFQPVKASSVEPEIRDYFSSPPQSAALPRSSTTLPMPSLDSRTFSTPERKKIYAAFTFTSPSPTSERFSKATRASSVPRLELV
ncbi:hypothetical protein Hypma_005789 [Hypsizygus marmoreus]|uniref:Uncharacterized protein n=1 Tax=Hypsizygus marmoreus TaxID=39966 RepID=A0A369KFZ7_HYPMA|nr:hypothetical protein Hypma_005789 [Hypsizygus marmoreus]